jgi:hypothetical protein
MNGWDLLTWLMSALLAGSAVVIFLLFLRDARGILKHVEHPEDDE